jgi:hypothetical protein
MHMRSQQINRSVCILGTNPVHGCLGGNATPGDQFARTAPTTLLVFCLNLEAE